MGDEVKGDKYTFNNSVIGSVGRKAKSKQQNSYLFSEDYAFVELSSQLELLRANLSSKARTAEELRAVEEVASAQKSAEKRKGAKMIKHLKKTGAWVFDVAKDIGVNLVSEILKTQAGI